MTSWSIRAYVWSKTGNEPPLNSEDAYFNGDLLMNLSIKRTRHSFRFFDERETRDCSNFEAVHLFSVVDAAKPSKTRLSNNFNTMARVNRFGFLAIALAFHLVYIYSIFDIYFVSPIVSGMREFGVERSKDVEAPSKRLVLFVGKSRRLPKTRTQLLIM